MVDQWTSAELFAELQAFRAALEAAGLQPNTVETYVGRSDTFLRWLVGDYTPRGPTSSGSTAASAGRRRSTRGEQSLAELSDTLSADALKRYLDDYLVAGGYDVALRDFRAETGTSLDLADTEHAAALFRWLRRWGCRHLRKKDTEHSVGAIQAWWLQWGSALPPADTELTRETGTSKEIAGAYTALASMPAAYRTSGDREVDVRLGDTAAAKTLFAIRPRVFPPWDEPIRVAFRAPSLDGSAYCSFLVLAARALEGAARRYGVEVGGLPALFGRPGSSPAKLVDEYLWTRITRGLGPEPEESDSFDG